MGTVTVVIPCFNYGRYLRDAVTSCLELQGVAVDVLIVDDCSPDETSEVGPSLAAQDSRVHYVRHESNRGHIATYNHGLALARRDYVALVSADDILTPGSLDRAVAALDATPEASFVYGPCLSTSEGKPGLQHRALGSQSASCSLRVTPGKEWSGRLFQLGKNVIHSPEVVARNSALKAVGGYRPELPHSGDLEMWLRLASVGDVIEVQGPAQAVRRFHSSNMSMSYPWANVQDLEQVEAAFACYDDWAAQRSPDHVSQLATARSAIAKRAVRSAARAFSWSSHIASLHARLALLDYAARIPPAVRRDVMYRLTDAAVRGNTPARVVLASRSQPRSTARQLRAQLSRARSR